MGEKRIIGVELHELSTGTYFKVVPDIHVPKHLQNKAFWKDSKGSAYNSKEGITYGAHEFQLVKVYEVDIME